MGHWREKTLDFSSQLHWNDSNDGIWQSSVIDDYAEIFSIFMIDNTLTVSTPVSIWLIFACSVQCASHEPTSLYSRYSSWHLSAHARHVRLKSRAGRAYVQSHSYDVNGGIGHAIVLERSWRRHFYFCSGKQINTRHKCMYERQISSCWSHGKMLLVSRYSDVQFAPHDKGHARV